ncbi:hypothetical protein P3X46_032151 [Hevea brasiliensis]|uniref:Reverse transcriptase zinc-binding domain-containing protein n=1 Tax=Hevea brasiliensis TaxID=3981 RepID=A0ABQ9KCD8_HEVBR|nr:hypothetical protein P3X46_032151 [Hevea brasiliensis]
MAIFHYPKCFCEQMNSIISRFWWGQKDNERKLAWLSWNKACRSKFRGGMGFKDLEKFNLSCLAEQSWRLITDPNSLWSRIIKGLYFPNSSFRNASHGRRSSWIWQGLLAGREVLRHGVRVNIGDGSSTLIWSDPWIPCHNFKVTRPSQCPPHINIVSDLMHQDSLAWNVGLVCQLFNPSTAKTILSIPIAPRGNEDYLVWHYENSGRYTVRSGYKVLVN